MLEQDKTFITIRYVKSKKFIALDPTSGGYPYDVESVKKANEFRDLADAQRYADMFNRSKYKVDDIEVVRVTLAYEAEKV